jgi:hypothetical protein
MCCAPLAIVDRRFPEVRNTRAVPAGERLLARNRRFTCGSVAGRKVYGETGSAGCLRATAALRADPSSDGKFTVKQVRRVACDQPPPPSPNGTTPTHTTEYSSTESVLLNPNRRHPNPPNDYCFRKFGSPCVPPMIVFFCLQWCHTHTHTNTVVRKVCCSTPIVATPTFPMITFFQKFGSPCVLPMIVFGGFTMVPHPHTHNRVQ